MSLTIAEIQFSFSAGFSCYEVYFLNQPAEIAAILQPLIHCVQQKFCNHIIHQVLQKFCDHSYTRCCRNSATTHSVGVAKILQPLIHKGYRRNSASTHTLNVTEIMWPTYTAGCCRNSASSHSLDVAEIHSCIQEYNSLSPTSQ